MKVDGMVYARCWALGMVMMVAIVLLLTGCATPFATLQRADDAAAARAGIPKAAVTQARNWLGIPIAGRPTVPEGYGIGWDSWLDGKLIDEARIVRVPRLYRLDGVQDVDTASPAVPPPAGQSGDDGGKLP